MGVEIDYEADSFAFLRNAPTGAVDVIITDPPYSEHVHANLCSGSLVGTKNVPKYELGFKPLTGYEWLADAVRVAKRWVVTFCDLEAFGLIKQTLPDEYVRGCVWYKTNAMGQLTADRPATAFEGVCLLHGKGGFYPKKRWNGKGSYGIWRSPGTRGKKDRHPNEKPLELAQKLVALFSERGETVLDPFCGSAAIGEACLRLGRDYVGLDNDSAGKGEGISWVARARERMCVVQADINLRGLPWLNDSYALTLCNMKGVDEAADA